MDLNLLLTEQPHSCSSWHSAEFGRAAAGDAAWNPRWAIARARCLTARGRLQRQASSDSRAADFRAMRHLAAAETGTSSATARRRSKTDRRSTNRSGGLIFVRSEQHRFLEIADRAANVNLKLLVAVDLMFGVGMFFFQCIDRGASIVAIFLHDGADGVVIAGLRGATDFRELLITQFFEELGFVDGICFVVEAGLQLAGGGFCFIWSGVLAEAERAEADDSKSGFRQQTRRNRGDENPALGATNASIAFSLRVGAARLESAACACQI